MSQHERKRSHWIWICRLLFSIFWAQCLLVFAIQRLLLMDVIVGWSSTRDTNRFLIPEIGLIHMGFNSEWTMRWGVLIWHEWWWCRYFWCWRDFWVSTYFFIYIEWYWPNSIHIRVNVKFWILGQCRLVCTQFRVNCGGFDWSECWGPFFHNSCIRLRCRSYCYSCVSWVNTD